MLPSLILAWFVVQGLIPIVPAEGRYRKPLEGLLVAQFVLIFGLMIQARLNKDDPEPSQRPSYIAKAVAFVKHILGQCFAACKPISQKLLFMPLL